MNLQQIRGTIDDISREYTALQGSNLLAIPEQQVLGRIERLRQKSEQVSSIIADLISMQSMSSQDIVLCNVNNDTLRSDIESLRARFLVDLRAHNAATKYSKKQASLEDNERIRANVDVITHLENIHRILSQEAARSEDCLRALRASTDVLRCVSHGHDSIAVTSIEGRRCIMELDKIERRDKRIVRSLFIAFCATAAMVVRHRLKRVHLYPPFLP